MVRQIVVDSSDTIAAWVQKVNKMSDSHMGDLDDLSSVFDSDVGRDIPDQDSNFVAALNHIGWLGPTIDNIIFGIDSSPGARPLGQDLDFRPRIIADSANFQKLNIGGLLNNDAAILVFDDAGRFGDSEGATSALAFDFNADSATFTKIEVRDSHNLDIIAGTNIQIGNVLVGGTGVISRIEQDNSSNIIFNNARIISNPATQLAESAFVSDRITIGTFITQAGQDAGFVSDSAYINRLHMASWDSSVLGDSVDFDVISSIKYFGDVMTVHKDLTVDSISINRLIMDDLIIDSVETFILGDSLGAPYFAAYSLEESN